MSNKKGDILGICIVIAAFIIAFTPPKLFKKQPQISRYQLIESTDTYLLDSKIGDLWVQGGVVNNEVQWHKQTLPNLIPPHKRDREVNRFKLHITKDNHILINTENGQMWIRGANISGTNQWLEQHLPNKTEKIQQIEGSDES